MRKFLPNAAFFSALLVFAYTEASVFCWANFLAVHQSTSHAVYGIRFGTWWSAFALGYMAAITSVELFNFAARNKGERIVIGIEVVLFVMSLIYIFEYRVIAVYS